MDQTTVLLVEQMLSGSRLALSRLITAVERMPSVVPELMALLYPRMGTGYCIGVTGAPGSGKSTLINQLVTRFRANQLSVGILAVDPSSARSGGAFLGDRIRMQAHYLDEHVFIRSLASRGCTGGLSENMAAMVNLMDAFGKSVVFVETIGTGQTDVAVRKVADTVVAIVTPEGGDTIQFLKAGIIEIADIVAVNKGSDLEAVRASLELAEALALSRQKGDWTVPVQSINALSGAGVDEIHRHVGAHRVYLETNRRLLRRTRIVKYENLRNTSQH